MSSHTYLSTACLHNQHDYCQSMYGHQGAKRPGQCKFCDAQCICHCHRTGNTWYSEIGAIPADGIDTARPTTD